MTDLWTCTLEDRDAMLAFNQKLWEVAEAAKIYLRYSADHNWRCESDKCVCGLDRLDTALLDLHRD